MFSFNNLKDQMPEMTAASMFSAYASVNAFIMLLRSIIQQLIPEPIRTYIYTKLSCFFTSSSDLTLVIDEYDGATANMVYGAAEIYLKTIAVSPTTKRLRAGKSQRQKTISFAIHSGENVHDTYDGLQLTWRFKTEEPSNGDEGGRRRNYSSDEKHRFELKFHRKHKDIVMGSYLPHVLARAEAIREEHKVVKLYSRYDLTSSYWTSVNLEHPSTFDTMALDPAVKTMIVDDLRRFVRRKEFYKRVGKAWKRGYLLYGPPGTGKSSLIAAMANFLKFHVYDLELTGISSNQELRRVLLNTANRSILVIEDVDCAGGLLNRKSEEKDVQNDANSPPGSKPAENSRLTLSGILNFIDGLWSSCGDERIIVFTTNHKDRLDPALLRPGRMDVHIHLSYCTASAFDILASNYLGMGDADRHPLCREIKDLMEKIEVTPAEVAEEMMKSEDVEVVLAEILSLLHRKKDQSNAKMDESEGNENPKRQKADQIVDDDGGAEAEEHFLGLGFCTQE